MTDEGTKLTLEESLSVLAETTKVQLATMWARIVTPTHDEEGNELDDEVFQNALNEAFYEQLDEFNKTLKLIGGRLLDAKIAATGGKRQSGFEVVKGGVDLGHPEASGR